MSEQELIPAGARVFISEPHEQFGTVVGVLTDSDGLVGYIVRIDGQTETSGPYRDVEVEA